MLVDPLDTDAIASAMLFLGENPEAKRRLAQKGLEWAKEFSWERMARETIKVYEEALKLTGKGVFR